MNKVTKSVRRLMIASVIVFSGCASVPSLDVMKAETASYQLPQLPQAAKAIVYIVRPSGLGGFVRFNVFVDDHEEASEMGYTRSSQDIYFHLKAGVHKIYSKAENWAVTEVTAKAGDIIFLQQEPSMGFLMAQNSIFKLDDYIGKYHVKTLKIGTIIKTEK